MTGRLLALTEAVTLDTNMVTNPGLTTPNADTHQHTAHSDRHT